jgi:DNA-binding NarL/FixJ family response regulator
MMQNSMSKQRKVILIVDDSILIVERLLDFIGSIENIGEIKHTDTYEKAELLFRQCKPDIVLLDIQLPDASGINLLNKIKSYHREVIVMMFSNHASSYYKSVCMELGADYFFDKSKDFDLIPGIISSLTEDTR